jgi:cytochrome c peroxidase
MSKTGGSYGGTIRFKEELAHGGNAGLGMVVTLLEPVKTKFPSISYADLYTLAGVTAIEAAGGPKVPWRAGRVDAMDPSGVTPDGR